MYLPQRVRLAMDSSKEFFEMVLGDGCFIIHETYFSYSRFKRVLLARYLV